MELGYVFRGMRDPEMKDELSSHVALSQAAVRVFVPHTW